MSHFDLGPRQDTSDLEPSRFPRAPSLYLPPTRRRACTGAMPAHAYGALARVRAYVHARACLRVTGGIACGPASRSVSGACPVYLKGPGAPGAGPGYGCGWWGGIGACRGL